MSHGNFPHTRLRRLRYNPVIRELVQEIKLDVNDFILPLFIRHGKNVKNPISSMPGHYQLSVDNLEEEIKTLTTLGIKAVILFGIPEKKMKQALMRIVTTALFKLLFTKLNELPRIC